MLLSIIIHTQRLVNATISLGRNALAISPTAEYNAGTKRPGDNPNLQVPITFTSARRITLAFRADGRLERIPDPDKNNAPS
jgi:hypothetical protein